MTTWTLSTTTSPCRTRILRAGGGNGEDWEDMEAGDSSSDGDLNKDTKGNDYHDCRDYHDCHYPNPLKGNDYQDIVEN